MNDRLTDIIARETDGKSCKAQKYSLDYDSQEYPQEETPKIWKKSAESSPRKKYIDLRSISRNLLHSDSQRLTYFLDGSRRVFKVDEIAYEHKKGKRIIYPVAAGQIGAGCCRRENRKLIPEKFIHETVIALPEIADSDGVPGFFPSIALKLNENPVIKRMGIKISSVLSYKTDRTGESLEDKATAAIQTRMLECEKELTEQIARHLGHMNYLPCQGRIVRVQEEITDSPAELQVGFRSLKDFQSLCVFPRRKRRPRIYSRASSVSQDSSGMFQQPGFSRRY